MKNQAQLIAYVDRLPGGTFHDLRRLLDGPLEGAFGGVHVLPFFHPIDGADAGFDPIDHTQVDPRLGTWDDVAAVATRVDVMADVIVNHVSRHSPQFVDWDRRGDDSPYAGMFLTYSRVFPRGARESDLLALNSPRPTLPFTRHTNAREEQTLLWTTFTSDQVDIDVRDPEARRYLTSILTRLHASKVRAIRLDAIGYAIKQCGTSCFMIPETRAFIDDVTAEAHALSMEVLVEVHGDYQTQIEVARQVDWVYDFALPPLVLHALYTRDATPLRRWLEIRPPNTITVLDTHDGIGVADVGAGRDGRIPGLLPPDAIDALIETIHERSGDESRLASGTSARNVDTAQINCTFYDALGRRDTEYLVARAIQCFLPGIPQIYYVGLLAGTNDLELLRRTGEGRDINRHRYTSAELQRALAQPVVRELVSLLHIRNRHAAFQGTFHVESPDAMRLVLAWNNAGAIARLDVDLAEMRATVTCSVDEAGVPAVVWCSSPHENEAMQGECR
ncbi:MAG TPA: sucrose phosphorylase [Vicinamibacterales bacterium]|nr:sucrose phosphorylase [Vicinamibacterales bacterium]